MNPFETPSPSDDIQTSPEELQLEIEKIIKDNFDSETSGHDLYHLKRVYNLALKIADKEGGDKIVIGAAAFLHDLHRIIQKETGKLCSPKASLPRVKEILDQLKLSEEQKIHILYCVEMHEEYSFNSQHEKVSDLETLIVQDADRIDSIGAVGVARLFTYCGAHNLPMYLPNIAIDENAYDANIHDPDAMQHIYKKLLKLKDSMNTKTGRQLIESRHAFLENFVQEFLAEWNSEK